MKNVVEQFDNYLVSRKLKFEAIIIGGAALNILDISSRKTKDVDCLDPEIPKAIKLASKEFALKTPELDLDIEWLNNGPKDLKLDLPKNWRNRLQLLFRGQAIHFQSLGRDDLIKTKLFAYCDRTTPDFEDLKNLNPDPLELKGSLNWVKDRDVNPSWADHVEKAFLHLARALGHE
jgi:Nucleotidyltransferase of unknown function (DUF6036)